MDLISAAAPLIPATVPFDGVASARLARMVEAGQRLIATARILSKTGDSVVREMTAGTTRLRPYAHYPMGDVIDRESGAQFFFHAHPHVHPTSDCPGTPGEAATGHFHCFMPAPAARSPRAVALCARGTGMTHLVAVEVDRQSFPVRLFTTNRWVTDETWVDAPAAARLVDRFVVELARPSLAVSIWISAMMRLFQPQIATLLAARDRAVAAHGRQVRDEDPQEDRALEIPSAVTVSVEGQMAALRAALALRGD